MPVYGYHGSILRVNLSADAFTVLHMDEAWYRTYAGGGLMGCYFLLKNTPPGLDAFNEKAMLILVSGVLAGQPGPGLARFCVAGKSPLSGGIAEARGEGPFGRFLKQSGYDAIIIEGRSKSPVTLLIEDGEPRLIPADDAWGMDTFETAGLYGQTLGVPRDAVISIGPAGENMVRYASLVTGGGNHAARLGMGAVMGSKNLKAVAVLGGSLPPVYDPGLLSSVSRSFEKEMPENELSMWQREPPGFSASADLKDIDVAYIGADNYRDNLRVRSSAFERQAYMPYFRGEHPCTDCPGGCMKRIGLAEDPLETTTIHQEITGSFGPNVGNGDLEKVLKVNSLCNRYGIDPVSMGFSISFLMECAENGLLPAELRDELALAQADVLSALVEKTARREGLGDLLAEGVKRAADKLGGGAHRYAMHVKGVEMVSFEPRTQVGLALGYALAPFGPRYDICEHDWDFDTISGWEHSLRFARTLGIFSRIPMQEQSIDKVVRFKSLYMIWSACDALNLCIFASAPTRLLQLEDMALLVKSVTGWETSSHEIMRWGERRNHIMRVYNLREGFTKLDDALPDRFFETPVSFGRLKGARLCRETFGTMISAFYEMSGWDEYGKPRPAVLADYGLSEFIQRDAGPTRSARPR